MALEQGYRVYQRVFTGTYANTSGVPAALVARMRRTFEADTTIVHYVDDHCTGAPKRRQRQRPVPAAPQ
jgi:hypothetical protein